MCNFVVKKVRTLNKLRSSKVVLSGYFREFLHAGSGKVHGETGTMHEKLDFHKFAQGKSYGANEEEIIGKDG